MDFTGLHRALGAEPGPLTSAMIDDAVLAGIRETDDLDWKKELPPARGLPQTDFPKDVAAMANAGGGVIVYGVGEDQKAATERLDVGTFDEGYERALRSAAVTAISPPVFGLGVVPLGEDGERVVVVVVPDSVDGPHLIYRGEHFGAPIRNDADTVWMRERQIEAMYRARFDERRYAHEALDSLYTEIADGRDIDSRAWFVGVARPRLAPTGRDRLPREAARLVAREGRGLALTFAGRGGIHPLESIDPLNPRPGLRRWILPTDATSESTRWRESWASIHDDASVTIASAIGGHRKREGQSSGDTVNVAAIECAMADLLGLLRATADRMGAHDYEVRIGIEWAGPTPLTFEASGGWEEYTTAMLTRYVPIRASIRADVDPGEYSGAVYDLVMDAVNQAGLLEPQMVAAPVRSEE